MTDSRKMNKIANLSSQNSKMIKNRGCHGAGNRLAFRSLLSVVYQRIIGIGTVLDYAASVYNSKNKEYHVNILHRDNPYGHHNSFLFITEPKYVHSCRPYRSHGKKNVHS